ncbi:RNA polymerase sigma factor [Bacillus aquiflavi]|uniref:RNA polymerase sigma factor n=1 Tax=Bacillus aquiflavi TaxID=2672567 RepID=UPI001CA8FAB3|nr:RNA polymerase sigma factor [Bacillus aquiflavi]UAC47984.1 RNA polymerase sigma factor [Bacillus aquiflavi]
MKVLNEENEKQQLHKDFEEHLTGLEEALFNYIYSLMRHRELAEDIYQEALLSAYLGFNSFKKNSKFKNWVYQIALNHCRDYWRKEKGRRRFWEEGVFDYINGIHYLQDPEDYIVGKYSQEEVLHKINELPGKYSEPIFLFYFRNCTITEISQETKLPLSTVKTRMRRAKERLRPKVKMLKAPCSF